MSDPRTMGPGWQFPSGGALQTPTAGDELVEIGGVPPKTQETLDYEKETPKLPPPDEIGQQAPADTQNPESGEGAMPVRPWVRLPSPLPPGDDRP